MGGDRVKLRYMIEFARRGELANPSYEPIGVWVQGPGPGLDVVIEFLQGNDEAQEEADWIINRLVEAEVKNLLPDFLEYHMDTLSAYHGMRGPIEETEEFAGAEVCAKAVLKRLKDG